MQNSLQKQRRYYDNRWSQKMFINELQVQRLNIILKGIQTINLAKPRILDFGCGTGWLTSILNHIGPTTGIDLSDKAIELAKNMYPSVEFICGNIFALHFQKESFDIIVSQEVIEHVDEQKSYLDLISEYLRKGGFLVLTTPNSFNLKRWSEKALESWGMQPIEKWLTQKELKELLSEFFKIIELKTFICGYGMKGIYRLINSVKINELLKFLKIKSLSDYIILKAGLGLHIFVLAERRASKDAC